MPWLEPIRIVTDWLNGDLHDCNAAPQGVNAKLQLVPRDPGDAIPANVTVVDATRDGSAALKRATAGVMMVRLYKDTSHSEVRTIFRDGDVPIVIGLALNDKDPAKNDQDESYIMRAVLFSLSELDLPQNASVRKRNRINVLSIDTPTVWPAEGQIGDRDITSAVRVTVKIRDTKPHGTEP